MAALQLSNKYISATGDTIYLIAEIGQNHQGNIDVAKEMILEAKRIGCNCVKFQKSFLEAKFTKSALNRVYNGDNSWGTTYGQHKEYLEFTTEQYKALQTFCNKIKIDFTASAMDEDSLSFLDSLDVPFIKIGSGDADNIPLLQKAALLHKPLVISTGMQTMETIDRIVKIMKDANKLNYALLHCVSSYPTQPKDCTLQLISLYKSRFPNIVIGYSGHENGIEITKAAVLLGARIVERHFTLDKSQKGSDHNCSLEPLEFCELSNFIGMFKKNGILKKLLESKNILNILGSSKQLESALVPVENKTILPCEFACKAKLGKSLVASRDLTIGHVLRPIDLCIKVSEPNGIPADRYEKVLGKKMISNTYQDCPLMFDHVIL